MSAPLLAAALSAVHAAVYAYGVLGARLDEAPRRLALLAVDSHRARRDQLAAAVRATGTDPEPPEPAYDVAVDDRAGALALAVRVEEGVAVRWRDLVTGTDDPALRSLAVAGLQECAVRAAQWRREAGRTPVTVALPGTA